ncbi:hypothetical protein CsSME_00046448 [Camellia sinensis var. sinensis]
MPSSSRPRAADVPSTSRAGTSRDGAGLVPPILPTYHHVGWPDILTELTGWGYGTSYPIPIEPPMPDHRYVSDPDSPPMPSLYTEPQVGPSRPSWGVGRGGSTSGRGRRRAPVVEESSDEEEPTHP